MTKSHPNQQFGLQQRENLTKQRRRKRTVEQMKIRGKKKEGSRERRRAVREFGQAIRLMINLFGGNFMKLCERKKF